MVTTVIPVEGMSCEHCVNAISKAVGELPGVSKVTVDLSAKTATVEHDSTKATIEAIKSAIEEQGFEV
jgi:copper chaperone